MKTISKLDHLYKYRKRHISLAIGIMAIFLPACINKNNMKQQKSDEIHDTLTVHPDGVSQEMITALLNKVKELEQAQRAEDVSGFLALFDEHAVWVNGVGTRLIGKEAIKEFTQQVLPGAFADGSSATYNVEHIVVLAPDIVLTAVRQTYFDSQGTVTSKGSPTYIWKHSNEQWTIVSGQNTVVKTVNE